MLLGETVIISISTWSDGRTAFTDGERFYVRLPGDGSYIRRPSIREKGEITERIKELNKIEWDNIEE